VCCQGVEERADVLFIKVGQWAFPDSGEFKDHILSCDVNKINKTMELYAQWILLLFHSYRGLRDLCPCKANTIFPFVYETMRVA
jgi:hypothetical protein